MSGPLHLLAQGQLAIWTGGLLAALSVGLQLWNHAIRPIGEARKARWAALGCGLVAAGLRLWVGSGPGDLAEAGRWSWLFMTAPPVDARTATVSVLLEPLLVAGVPGRFIYDSFGPVTSGLCAAATVALAVRVGSSTGAAGAAGMTLALWPAHVVFGTGGALTVWGGLGWIMLLLTASDPRLTPAWRVWGSAGWAVILMNSRPEYLPAPLLLLLAARLLRWPRLAWVQLVVALAVLGPWTSLLAPKETPGEGPLALAPRTAGWMPLYWQFFAASVAPVWACAAGLAGLWWVRPRGLGLMMALLWGGLMGAYSLHADGSHVFGSWRYLLSVLPVLLAGAATGLSRLPLVAQRIGGAVLVVSCLPYAPLWLWPSELLAEFSALRETAPAVLGGTSVLVLDDDDGDAGLGYEHRDRALLALSLEGAGRWSLAARASASPLSAGTPLGWLGGRPVYSLATWLRLEQPPMGPTALWIGAATDRSERQAVAQRTGSPFVLVRAARVWPVLADQGWCQATGVGSGLAAKQCQLELGWGALSWPASSVTPNR